MSANRALAAFFLVFAGFLAGALLTKLTEPYRYLWNDAEIFEFKSTGPVILNNALKRDKSERVGLAVITQENVYTIVPNHLKEKGYRMLAGIADEKGAVYQNNFDKK